MELTKKKILVFVDWYLPAFKAGGPIRSVYNLISRMSSEFEFYVITGDRDLGDNKAFENVELDRWLKHEEAHVIYLSKVNQNRKLITTLIKEINPSKIYLNSLFSFSFTLLPLSLKKKFSNIQFILAPRGMLGRGALEIKRSKKKIFIQLSKALNLYKGILWHATNELEKDDILRSFGKDSNVQIADNLATGQSLKIEDLLAEKKKDFGRKRFLFVSRISRKKNVDLLIDFFNSIDDGSFRFRLDIIGTMEDKEYFNELKEQSKKSASIFIQKALHPDDLVSYYSKAHFFCLPTKHENYGHAIIEALSYACPTIVSDQTPWRDLKNKNIGWDLSLDKPESFIHVIQNCIQMNEDEYLVMAKNAFDFAQAHIYKEDVLNAYRKLLL